jgi:hypothetical protein
LGKILLRRFFLNMFFSQEQELRIQIPERRADSSEDESARDGPRDTARSAASG